MFLRYLDLIFFQIAFSSLYNYCNTLVIDVKPWALLINHTGEEILLTEGDSFDHTWFIAPGVVFAPPKLDGFFKLGITENGQQYHSGALQLSKEERWYTLKFEGRIPRKGSTNLKINTENCVCFITILTKFEKNIEIIQLLPMHSIVNNTRGDLDLRKLYVHSSDEKVCLPTNFNAASLDSQKGCSRPKETPLLMWNKINKENSFNSQEEFKCIQLGHHGIFGHPVILREFSNDQRTNFTLPILDSDTILLNESYLMTSHQMNGQIKIIIQNDSSPQMIIYNNTEVLLVLGKY